MSPKRIKIAYVIDGIRTPTGGTESQLLHLLAHIDRARFDPVLYSLYRSEWLEQEYDQASWINLGIHISARPQLPFQIHRFANELRRAQVDVVQTHFRDANIAGVLAASMAGVKTIISTRRGVPYWNSRAGLWMLRGINLGATWFLANSRATKDRYVREEGLDASRFDVIYNGLDPELFRGLDRGARLQLREQLQLPPNAPVIGLVANLRSVKGIGDFIQAAHILRHSHPEAHFVIVGQGQEEAFLRGMCEDLGLTQQVHLLGVRLDVPKLLQCFDVGVLCSHFESFSNSVLEYMAAGLPVVVSDVGGVREAVRNGHQGFVVPPKAPALLAQKIGLLLAHEGGPRAWPGAGDLDDRFRLSQMVRAHEGFYVRQVGRRSTLVKQRVYGTLSKLGVPRLFRRLHRDELTIVMYHGFTSRERGADIENIEGLHLHIDAFRQQLNHLHDHFNVISLDSALDAMERGQDLPPHAVAITMDDGYRSNYRLAFPLLCEFSMPATIFLTTRFVDENQFLWTDRLEYAMNRAEEGALRSVESHHNVGLGPEDTIAARGRLLRSVKRLFKSIPQSRRQAQLSQIEAELGYALAHSESVPHIYESLNWLEVKEMLGSGLVSIGSHSVSHFSLANCEEDVIEHEVREARAIIEDRTGADCPLFCYPNGTVRDFDARTQRAVRAAGHRCALTAVAGFNKPQADPFTLKRVGVMNEDTPNDFEMVLCGARQMLRGDGRRTRRLGLIE